MLPLYSIYAGSACHSSWTCFALTAARLEKNQFKGLCIHQAQSQTCGRHCMSSNRDDVVENNFGFWNSQGWNGIGDVGLRWDPAPFVLFLFVCIGTMRKSGWGICISSFRWLSVVVVAWLPPDLVRVTWILGVFSLSCSKKCLCIYKGLSLWAESPTVQGEKEIVSSHMQIKLQLITLMILHCVHGETARQCLMTATSLAHQLEFSSLAAFEDFLILFNSNCLVEPQHHYGSMAMPIWTSFDLRQEILSSSWSCCWHYSQCGWQRCTGGARLRKSASIWGCWR